MSEYFDRNGDPISIKQWFEMTDDPNFRNIRKTTLDNGTRISTIWLGLARGYGPNGPLIFETMLFSPDEGEQECYKYATEEEAIEHHEHLVETYYDEQEEISRWSQVADEL